MKPQDPRKKNKAFTMAELLIVIVCVGLLAAVAVPTINGVRDSLLDSTKVRNADKLNEYMCAIFNGGVDTSAYADGSAALTALQAGVSIPSPMAGGTPILIRLEKQLNPAAYTFTAGTATTAPRFVAKLNERDVRP